MKFSSAVVLAIAGGVAALPWSSKSAKHDVFDKNQDITLHIEVFQNPKHVGAIRPASFDICLRVCWPETPTCPEGWYSNNMGTNDEPCWTCCKSPENSDL